MPAIAHTNRYQQDGYCLINQLIPEDLIDRARLRTLEICEQLPDWNDVNALQVLDPAVTRNARGEPYPIGLQRPSRFESVFHDMAHHPALVSAMEELLEGPVEHFTDQVGIKHGFLSSEQGGRSYYHQDSWYWKINPALGCNVWIPLAEVGQDSIALAIMPGSQRGWELIEHEGYEDDPPWGRYRQEAFQAFKRWRIPLKGLDTSDEILFPMQPGDGLFFTNHTWHRSEPNRTGRTLAFYAIAYRRKS